MGPDTYTASVRGSTATFHCKSKYEIETFQPRLHERKVLTQFIDVISPGSVFYDVGANIGLWSLLAADCGAEAIAFEPLPANHSRIADNCQINDSGNVCIQEFALSDETGTAELAQLHDAPGGNNGMDDGWVEENETIEIPIRVGDDLVATGEVPPPDVIKIDVEGHEMAVIDGLAETIASNHPTLFVEIHPSALDVDSSTVEEKLERVGYELEQLSTPSHERSYHLLAK